MILIPQESFQHSTMLPFGTPYNLVE